MVRGCRKTGRAAEYAQRMLQERQSLPCVPFCSATDAAVLTEENLSKYMANQEENNQAAVTVDTSKVAPDVILDFLGKGYPGRDLQFC